MRGICRCKWIRLCMILVMIFTLFSTTVKTQAANDKNANRMNVVFVLDASGSMNNTDSEGWRYEAVDLFLGLAINDGNYMGAVVFNEDIVLEQNLSSINGLEAKKKITQQIQESKVGGDTNIGKAIELATQMLQQSGNPDLSSAIILLSDGNTDLPNDTTGEELKASEASKANAIQNARQNGYPIYCVGLNANNKANPQELQNIADATGGVFVEVNNAEDLKKVFSQFYNMVYSTQTVTLAETKIPDNGTLDVPFKIPGMGVEEANIIINTLNSNTSYAIFQPNGIALMESELDSMRINANSFTVVKIPNPEPGEWKIEVRGISGDDVKIDMVYNTNYRIEINNPSTEEFKLGESIQFEAVLYADNQVVADTEVYKNYPATLVLTEVNSDKSEENAMQCSDAKYQYTANINEYKSYNAVVKVMIDGMEVDSKGLLITIGNTNPKPLKPIVKIKTFIPFGRKVKELDLAGMAADQEDTSLTYEITSSPFDSKLVYKEGNILKASVREIDNGTVTITATDSQGGSCNFEIRYIAINILVIILIIFCAFIGLFVIFLIINNIMVNSKIFNGDIMVVSFDDEEGEVSVPQTISPPKGKIPLFRYISNSVGIDLKKSSFLATGKDYIFIISKKGYFSTMAMETRNKKIRIDGDMEITISNNSELSSGLKITFMPFRQY